MDRNPFRSSPGTYGSTVLTPDLESNSLPRLAVTQPLLESPSKSAKRKQVKKACTNCRKAHAACDETRPCQRCRDNNLHASCVDVKRKKRTRQRRQGGSTKTTRTRMDMLGYHADVLNHPSSGESLALTSLHPAPFDGVSYSQMSDHHKGYHEAYQVMMENAELKRHIIKLESAIFDSLAEAHNYRMANEASEKRLAWLLQPKGMSVWDIDAEFNLSFLQCNDMFCKIIGRSRTQLEESGACSLLFPTRLHADFQRFKGVVVRAGSVVVQIMYVLYNASEKPVWMSLTLLESDNPAVGKRVILELRDKSGEK